MAGSWIGELVRSFFGSLRSGPRPERRRSASLRVEPLELRTLPSGIVLEPLAVDLTKPSLGSVHPAGPSVAQGRHFISLVPPSANSPLPMPELDVSDFLQPDASDDSGDDVALDGSEDADPSGPLTPFGQDISLTPGLGNAGDAEDATATQPVGSVPIGRPAAIAATAVSGSVHDVVTVREVAWVGPPQLPSNTTVAAPPVENGQVSIEFRVATEGAASAVGAVARLDAAQTESLALTVLEIAAPQAQPESLSSDATSQGELQASIRELPDGALLQRFVDQRDQGAFATLVDRYQGLVPGICKQVLGDLQAAEDALQATLLVLVRKAGMLDPYRPLTNWLCLVAYHVALRLRGVVAKRRRHEMNAAGLRLRRDEESGFTEVETDELRGMLRHELQRMPEKYRVPLTMCYFDGHTHVEAARVTGIPRGSIAKRINEGLEMLRERLVARGITF